MFVCLILLLLICTSSIYAKCAFGVFYGNVTNRWAQASLVPIGGPLSWVDACSAQDMRQKVVSPACPQIPDPQIPVPVPWRMKQSENCLTANVFVPDGRKGSGKLPVLVFFYGGSYEVGSNANPLYDGSAFTDTNTIMVSFNYRLGALGFAGFVNDDDNGVGNYGLMDANLAMQWLHLQLLPRINGDPERVTIFGESAGGGLVCQMLASPRVDAFHGFTGAMMESGRCDDVFSKQLSIDRAQQLLALLDCDDVDCARSRPVRQVLAAQAKLPEAPFGMTQWGPTADGVWLEQAAVDRFYERGLHPGTAVRSVIIGTNANESSLFALASSAGRALTKSQLDGMLALKFRGNQSAVAEAYRLYPLDAPAPPPPPPGVGPAPPATPAAFAYSRMLTDFVFVCPAYRAAWGLATGGVLSKGVAAKTFLYLDSFVPQCSYAFLPPEFLPMLGAFHSSELFYAFGTHPSRCNMTEAAVNLSQRWVRRWASMAARGSPDPGLWQPVAPARDGSPYNMSALQMTGSIDWMFSGYHGANCQFWDEQTQMQKEK